MALHLFSNKLKTGFKIYSCISGLHTRTSEFKEEQ